MCIWSRLQAYVSYSRSFLIPTLLCASRLFVWTRRTDNARPHLLPWGSSSWTSFNGSYVRGARNPDRNGVATGQCSQISFYYFSMSTINANHLVHRQRSMISGPSNALVGHQTRDGMTSYVPEIKRVVGPMRVGMTSYEPQDPAVLLERRNELRASRRGNWY